MDIETALATVNKIQEHARLLEEQKEKLQEEHAGMVDSLKIIRPFKDLDYDISTILNFKYIHYRFGRIEKQYLQKFEKYIYDNLDTLFIKCGEDEQYVYGVYFVPEHEAHKVHAVYSSMLLNVFSSRTTIRVPPEKPLKRLISGTATSTRVWMPTKQNISTS